MKKTMLQFPDSMFIDSHLLYCIGISQKKKKENKKGAIETGMKHLFA